MTPSGGSSSIRPVWLDGSPPGLRATSHVRRRTLARAEHQVQASCKPRAFRAVRPSASSAVRLGLTMGRYPSVMGRNGRRTARDGKNATCLPQARGRAPTLHAPRSTLHERSPRARERARPRPTTSGSLLRSRARSRAGGSWAWFVGRGPWTGSEARETLAGCRAPRPGRRRSWSVVRSRKMRLRGARSAAARIAPRRRFRAGRRATAAAKPLVLTAQRSLSSARSSVPRGHPSEAERAREREHDVRAWPSRRTVIVGSAGGCQRSAISHQLGASRSSRLGGRSFGVSAFFTRRVTNRMS